MSEAVRMKLIYNTRDGYLQMWKKGDAGSYDEERDILISASGEDICSLDFYCEFMERWGRNFECVYDEHASCFSVLRCKDCGTVILSHYDENYEHFLRCPTCTPYKTLFAFYTAEQIKEDEDLQKMVSIYESFARTQEEQYKRIERRGGKMDWQLFVWKKTFSWFHLCIEIQNMVGLSIFISYSVKHPKSISATQKWSLRLPIGLRAWKSFFKNPLNCFQYWKSVKRDVYSVSLNKRKAKIGDCILVTNPDNAYCGLRGELSGISADKTELSLDFRPFYVGEAAKRVFTDLVKVKNYPGKVYRQFLYNSEGIDVDFNDLCYGSVETDGAVLFTRYKI